MSRSRWALLALTATTPLGVTAGCGSVSERGDGSAGASADAGGLDAGGADAAAGDASPARCDPTAPFGAPVAVAGLNSQSSDESARLSPDELTVTFSSDRPDGLGAFDLYIATRAGREDDFGEPRLIAGASAATDERNPTITGDGLFLYASTQPNGDIDISSSRRDDTSASFGPLEPVVELNTASTDVSPYVLPDHGAVYFASDRDGDFDLYRATRNGDGFDEPVLVAGTNLAAPGIEGDAVLTPDELNLYFSSDRNGAGVVQVFTATRRSVAEGFGEPVEIPEVDVSGNDFVWPTWISADNCALYLTTTPLPGDFDTEHFEIYAAVRGR